MPDRRAARSGRQAEDAGDRGHRARQHVLVGDLSRSRAGARAESDSRLRGVRRARRSAGPQRRPRRDAEPPGAAGREPRGLPQPDQAGVGRLHRRVLLQAAHRQGAARAAREGADRPEQLPEGRGRRRAVAPAGAEGDRGGRRVSRHPRPGQFLPRDAVARHRGAAARQQRPAGDRARSRAAAGLHQRRALPARRRRAPARHPAVHRHRQGVQRSEAAALRREAVLPEDRRGDGGGLQGLSRTRSRTRCGSPSAAT